MSALPIMQLSYTNNILVITKIQDSVMVLRKHKHVIKNHLSILAVVYSILKSHFKTGDQLFFMQKYIFLINPETIKTFWEHISYSFRES